MIEEADEAELTELDTDIQKQECLRDLRLRQPHRRQALVLLGVTR